MKKLGSALAGPLALPCMACACGQRISMVVCGRASLQWRAIEEAVSSLQWKSGNGKTKL